MHLQDMAMGLVKPREHDDFAADRKAFKALGNLRVHVDPCVGRTFAPLVGCRFPG
jgi:hypothetical protein